MFYVDRVIDCKILLTAIFKSNLNDESFLLIEESQFSLEVAR